MPHIDSKLSPADREALVAFAEAAFAAGARTDWRSHDPYDILLSPFATPLRSRWPLAARILIQAGKRTGVRARTLLRVPRHEEPKAIADFTAAAALLAQSGESWARARAAELSDRLVRSAVRTAHGYGWALQFPWVSRFGRMNAGEPNNYTTTTACQALLDAAAVEQLPAALEAARRGADFILGGLGSFTYAGRSWLRYTAGSTSPIINIQASSASLLARVGRAEGDDSLLAAADRAVEAVVASQAEDGRWTYSADARGGFVDGFHTGFILQGLHEYSRWRGEEAAVPTATAIERGFRYFTTHLLDDRGLPLDFADGSVDLGGQNAAQAIQTLVVCGREAERATALRIWEAAVGGRSPAAGEPALRWELGPLVVATAFLV